MHTKRDIILKSWPIPRKGTKFIISPGNNRDNGMPILVILRDLLKVVETRKELKKILMEGKVIVNQKKIREENYPLVLFDTLNLPEANKSYRFTILLGGKFGLEEISEKDSKTKISKILNKRIIKNKLTQLNLSDGRNVVFKEKCNVGDSVLLNLTDNKIEKVIPIKEKSKVLIIKGKHIGKAGEISKIEETEAIVNYKDSKLKINLHELIALS